MGGSAAAARTGVRMLHRYVLLLLMLRLLMRLLLRTRL
jgi:hypothetical protein